MSIVTSYNGNSPHSSIIYANKLNQLVESNNLTRYVERIPKAIQEEEGISNEDMFSKVLDAITSSNLSVIFVLTSKSRYDSSILAFHTINKIVLNVEWSSPHISIEGYGDNIESIEALIKDIHDKFPEIEEEEELPEQEVNFRFWHRTIGGASAYDKVQECPGLSSMTKNYSPKVAEDLEKLLSMDKPDEKGKVIIWHGKPGCGKTYAVRALARDWAYNRGASIEIILDPHEFLEDMSYMRQVILSRPRYREATVDEPNNPIRLIILEDHAELFTTKCRESRGLSTILNLTDGILGKDLRLVFLLTANEDIKEIDPAIKRPRRCIGITEFTGFSKEEAVAWSQDKSGKFEKKLIDIHGLRDEYSLVEMYHAQDLIKEEESVNESEKELLLHS